MVYMPHTHFTACFPLDASSFIALNTLNTLQSCCFKSFMHQAQQAIFLVCTSRPGREQWLCYAAFTPKAMGRRDSTHSQPIDLYVDTTPARRLERVYTLTMSTYMSPRLFWHERGFRAQCRRCGPTSSRPISAWASLSRFSAIWSRILGSLWTDWSMLMCTSTDPLLCKETDCSRGLIKWGGGREGQNNERQ